MMNSRKSNINSGWKYFFLLPLLIVFACVLNEPVAHAQDENKTANKNSNPNTQKQKLKSTQSKPAAKSSQDKSSNNKNENKNKDRERLSDVIWATHQTIVEQRGRARQMDPRGWTEFS